MLVLATAASFAGLDAPGERERLAPSVAAEPALRGLYGQPYDLSTIGGATAWRMGHGGAAILAGLTVLPGAAHHSQPLDPAAEVGRVLVDFLHQGVGPRPP